jgi:hypothetical protein
MERRVVRLGFDESVPCVVMEWDGYATVEQFRTGNEEVLALIRERGARKLLGELRSFTLIHRESQEWLNETWIPRAIDTGLRACALVMPVFYFNRVAVEQVTERIGSPALRVSFFQETISAREWLRRA